MVEIIIQKAEAILFTKANRLLNNSKYVYLFYVYTFIFYLLGKTTACWGCQADRNRWTAKVNKMYNKTNFYFYIRPYQCNMNSFETAPKNITFSTSNSVSTLIRKCLLVTVWHYDTNKDMVNANGSLGWMHSEQWVHAV